MHQNSVLLFRKYALPRFNAGMRVLEVGPDGNPSTYRREISAPIIWSTTDLASQVDAGGERLWGTGAARDLTLPMRSEYDIPAPDAAFDIVVSGQVIEHVRKPWIWMKELARVCAPDGVVVTVNPVSWPYHEAPIDCWRIYPEGMRALCEEAGLNVELTRCDSLEERPLSWFPGKSSSQSTRGMAAANRI
jgi:SAM-dependent methyltransferase